MVFSGPLILLASHLWLLGVDMGGGFKRAAGGESSARLMEVRVDVSSLDLCAVMVFRVF